MDKTAESPGHFPTVFPDSIPTPDQIDSPAPLVDAWVDIRKKLTGILETVPGDLFATDPGKAGWSAGENAEHLFRTQLSFARLVPAALSGRLGLDRDALKKWPYQPLFRRVSEPGKAKNPESVTPADHWSRTDSLKKLDRSMKAMEEAMNGKSLTELEQRGFPHPLFGPVSLIDWCFILVAHEIAHGKSLERKYPSAG